MYKHFESKEALLMAYLDLYQNEWYERIEPYLASFSDPKDKILALFEFRIFYQEKNLFPGCPFIKINAEVGFNNEKVNLRVREGKDHFKIFIHNLVKEAAHPKKISDDELTDLVFLLIEGGLSSAAIYKSSIELKKGKNLVNFFLY